MASFLKKVMNTPKMKSIRKKIDKLNREKKILGKQFRTTLKRESRRLSK